MEDTDYPIQDVPRTSTRETKWRDAFNIAELDLFWQILTVYEWAKQTITFTTSQPTYPRIVCLCGKEDQLGPLVSLPGHLAISEDIFTFYAWNEELLLAIVIDLQRKTSWSFEESSRIPRLRKPTLNTPANNHKNSRNKHRDSLTRLKLWWNMVDFNFMRKFIKTMSVLKVYFKIY